MEDNIILYKRYLNTISPILDRYFDNQKEYIACRKGCAHCCEKGVYPYSQVEFEYLLRGLLCLENDKRQRVIDRIKKLKEETKDVKDFRHFMYRCPFLDDDNSCSVYEFRGIICRTFGLLKYENEKIILPFCHTLGLNYSDVYNKSLNKIVEKNGYKSKPKAYNITLKTLTDKSMFEKMPDFGETKSLIEWL